MSEFTPLPTNLVDDELSLSQDGKRTYNIVDGEGNIVAEGIHFVDTSTYTTVGSNYGAEQINAQNEAINGLNEDLTANNDQKFRFGYDSTSGKYGYITESGGADTFNPFSSEPTYIVKQGTLQSGYSWDKFCNNTSYGSTNSTAVYSHYYTEASFGFGGTRYSKLVDLSKYSKIRVVTHSWYGGGNYHFLVLADSTTSFSQGWQLRLGVTEVDISSINSSKYIALVNYSTWDGSIHGMAGLPTAGSGSSKTTYFSIDEVCLIP